MGNFRTVILIALGTLALAIFTITARADAGRGSVNALDVGLIRAPQSSAPSMLPHPADQPPIKMTVSIGLGFQLCPDRAPSSISTAFECSGLAPTPESIELELVNKPAAQPDWLYYEAPYTTTETFFGVKTTVELLVMYAKYNGITSGFVDGRIKSEKSGTSTPWVYFRTSAVGGLDHLTYASSFAPAVRIKPKGSKVYLQYQANMALDAGK